MGCRYLQLDLAEVERLAGLGLTDGEISTSLGIHVATMTRRKRDSEEFREAMRRGKARARAQVASKLMQAIDEGNIAAIIWWEKTRVGLSDRIEIGGMEKPIITSESCHPLTGFTGRPVTDSSRLLEDNGSGSWPPLGEDGSWSSDGGDDGPRT
jgi:hypothetical protein